MPITPKRMPFLEHLDEFRKRLSIIVVVLFGGAIAVYPWALEVYEFIMDPVFASTADVRSVAMAPFELFTIRFVMGLFAAAIVTSPITIYEVMAFFLPALKPKERKWFVPVFISMVVFFVGGVVFCYLFVLEPGFEWLLAQGGETIDMLPRASDFFRGVVLFLLGFGLGFQTPVVVFGLVLMDIVPYEKMRENWRVAYVVIMVVASVATPDWSWVTMLSLFGAMLILYEGALLAARVLLRKRIVAQKAAEALE
jgi:sec-independent protein translocase protein TatC